MISVVRSENTGDWHLDDGRWHHISKRFFSVSPKFDQYGAILYQPEIGCLGLLIVVDPVDQIKRFLIQKKL